MYLCIHTFPAFFTYTKLILHCKKVCRGGRLLARRRARTDYACLSPDTEGTCPSTEMANSEHSCGASRANGFMVSFIAAPLKSHRGCS